MRVADTSVNVADTSVNGREVFLPASVTVRCLSPSVQNMTWTLAAGKSACTASGAWA